LNILSLINRKESLITDVEIFDKEISNIVSKSKFLVIGGAGSIGQAVVKEIFSRYPIKLHVVDISENNLVELVRDIRSSFGYIEGEFKTFALDAGSREFEVYFNNEDTFDYVLNLSALKHVRSEKDPYTLMRMIDVNIINTIKTLELSIEKGVKKYFCVSTDKAANPVNMMGASKRIMEMFLNKYKNLISISTARFANVAFSDGSLLHGFTQRILKNQPIAAPNDVRRYFVTPKESGELCLMSTILGKQVEIFFPKLDEKLHMLTFSEIAINYLKQKGYDAFECASEEEARKKFGQKINDKKWPCYFSQSDTTGEKDYEEFYIENENIDMDRFKSLGVVISSASSSEDALNAFLVKIEEFKKVGRWTRNEIIDLFKSIIPEFYHQEKGKFLDGKM